MTATATDRRVAHLIGAIERGQVSQEGMALLVDTIRGCVEKTLADTINLPVPSIVEAKTPGAEIGTNTHHGLGAEGALDMSKTALEVQVWIDNGFPADQVRAFAKDWHHLHQTRHTRMELGTWLAHQFTTTPRDKGKDRSR